MKLNLGCGGDKKQGYINIDVRKEVNPDLVIDLEKELLSRFDNETIDEIIAKDFIEHLPFRRVEAFLKDCYRVLKKGGRIYIQTPDLEAIAKKVIFNPNFKLGGLEGWKAISYWVYGGQEYSENYHKSGFTIPTMRKLLEEIGFKIEKIENDGGTNLCCWAIR